MKVTDAICNLVGALASLTHLDANQEVGLVLELNLSLRNHIDGFPRLIWDYNVTKNSPIVKGTWVSVGHLMSLLRGEWTFDQILTDHPELTAEDINESMRYYVTYQSTE